MNHPFISKVAEPLSLPFTGALDVAEHATEDLADLMIEQVWLYCLDGKTRLRAKVLISQGCLSSSILRPREVMIAAFANHAHSIILVHNHPSGDPTPSHEDMLVTEALHKACKLMDMPLLDHIIIGREGWVNMASMGIGGF